jgi:inosine-uridine nucleoside N-ribohydrolase
MTLIATWAGNTQNMPVLHDPLALAVALQPGLVETESLALDVVTSPGPGHGITCIVRDGRPPVDVALRVDGPRFVDWFTAQLSAA